MNSELQAVIAQLDALGCEPKPAGDGYEAYCPVHELDGKRHKKSLSIKQGHSVPAVCHCHAGCSYYDLLKVVPTMQVKGRQIEAEYRYRSAIGKVEFVKVRYYPKDFAIRNPNISDKSDKRAYKLPVAKDIGEYPLYNLPDVLTAKDTGETVYYVEGEKDADRLVKHGLTVTTNYEGAGKWKAEYDSQLAGLKSLVLIPDNDEPGRAHVATIAARLQGKVNEVIILDLVKSHPSLRPKGDVSDWLNAGHSIEELIELVVKTSPPESPTSHMEAPTGGATEKGKVKGIDGDELLRKEFAPTVWLVPDMLPNIGMFLLAGKQKLGKSWFALSLALAHIYGGSFLNRTIPKGKVLYLALEDSEKRMKERIVLLQPDAPNSLSVFKNIHFFHATDKVPRLDQGFSQFVEPYLSGVTLMIVDILQKIRPIKSTGNIYQDDYLVMTALQEIALKHSICILALTHTRKQEADDAFDEIMSSGGLTGAADGSLVLKRKRGNGAAILHTTGREISESEHGLRFDSGVWTYAGTAAEVKASDEQNEIFNLLREAGADGMTCSAICEELGKGGPAVRKLLRKLEDAGRVRERHTKPAPHYAVCDGPNAPPL